jgi:hypothetical protein
MLRVERLTAVNGGVAGAAPVLDLRDVRRAEIVGSKALPGTGVYVAVSGPKSHDVLLSGNDLREAETECRSSGDVPGYAIRRS